MATAPYPGGEESRKRDEAYAQSPVARARQLWFDGKCKRKTLLYCAACDRREVAEIFTSELGTFIVVRTFQHFPRPTLQRDITSWLLLFLDGPHAGMSPATFGRVAEFKAACEVHGRLVIPSAQELLGLAPKGSLRPATRPR